MSRSSRTKYQFFQEASLSQKLAASKKGALYQKLAGTDREISDSIATLSYLTDTEANELLNENPLEWLIGLLNVMRMSAFATSEKVNEITKMGMQMPKAEDIISTFAEDED